MRCEHCLHDLPVSARFCPGCGQAVPAHLAPPAEEPVDTSITAPGVRPGAWHWMLIVLLVAERLTALKAFPTEGAASWERLFLYGWGWGLLILTAPLLIFRRRAGGWLAFLSGVALIVRSCVPLLGEAPVPWAVITLMVASATLTFAFLHEQSFWPHLPSPMGGNRQDQESDRSGEPR